MKPMKYPPINPKFPHFLHGGDYNPDQWKDTPEVWDEDMRLMKLAHCNVMSVGIFSWASLEPEEGKFEFGWLDTIMDKLAENGVYVILATPSGARPAWLAQKYPEVLRVLPNRQRILFGGRHNHCYTSPVYREKTRLINQKLAERYKDHPALLAWHVSNEYGGECHCELCQQAFREWLKKKYDNDLDKLNRAWWTGFWSHTYTDWDQIQSPAPHGEGSIHGLNLDWKRFVTHQTIEFMKNEIAPLREITPNVPVTTNFMGTYTGLNYWKFAPELDVISWDNYPMWHGEEPDWELAYKVAFVHDINRSLKGGKPFMLMESTPSMTNWQPVAKLKRPGMHLLSSIQAVAHGSDTVQYFQWRKSRGCVEKFHGAVVDHCGHENTRVFKDVAEVGKVLEKLDPIVGTTVRPEVAIIYDWENRWAIDDAQGPRREKKDYLLTCQSHYRTFWENGVPVDVIDMDCDFSGYKLLIAPMLYMVRPGVAERIEKFVEKGGTFVTTYWSGIVDENDLCFLGGFPGPLRKVTGIWSEEIDALYDHDVNHVVLKDGNPLGLKGEYEARELCDLIHAETAEVLATYKSDFYAGRPALTVNSFGKGKAYYIAFRNNGDFLTDFYGALIRELNLKRAVDTELPQGVTAQMRTDGERVFVFILNFVPEERQVDLKDMRFKDMITGENVTGRVSLPPYGVKILERL
ncbi:beta-galactosidase [Caldicoprobacter guelmensis]|uniref:beta-galactosidase n=1 Tax=Caldicoprobacter guelmensis TaxID=1170224 RepID=UPI003744309B|nr:beta-galactosidase [Caldicoprobacter guelmensis]